MVTTTTLAINVLTGMAIPAIVGIITRQHAPKWVLATENLGLSAASGTLVALATASHIDWRAALVSFGSTWAMSIGTHFGFLKPSGVSDALLGKGGVVGPTSAPADTGGDGSSDASSPAPDLPPQPAPDPSVIDSDSPPADAPPPPDGYVSSADPEDAAPADLGQPDPPAYLATAAGKATVRAARATAPRPARSATKKPAARKGAPRR